MSVDFVGTMHAPVPLDALVTTARETLARLLGLRAIPVIDVIADRRFDQGALLTRDGASVIRNSAPFWSASVFPALLWRIRANATSPSVLPDRGTWFD